MTQRTGTRGDVRPRTIVPCRASSVVREALQSYGAEESEFDRLVRLEKEIRADLEARGIGVVGGDRLLREELYDPDRVRAERRAAWE